MDEEPTDNLGVECGRNRYYDSVEKHDLQEKTQAQNEQILKRSLLRLAVVVDHVDAATVSIGLREVRLAGYWVLSQRFGNQRSLDALQHIYERNRNHLMTHNVILGEIRAKNRNGDARRVNNVC